MKIINKLKTALESKVRRKKFEKMKKQLETPKVRRPAAKSIPKR